MMPVLPGAATEMRDALTSNPAYGREQVIRANRRVASNACG